MRDNAITICKEDEEDIDLVISKTKKSNNQPHPKDNQKVLHLLSTPSIFAINLTIDQALAKTPQELKALCQAARKQIKKYQHRQINWPHLEKINKSTSNSSPRPRT